MRAVVYDFHTEIFPDREDIEKLCKIGHGADTCIFLTVSGNGFECHGLNKQPIWSLIKRARRGETNAQREGCNTVNHWTIPGMGEQEIIVLPSPQEQTFTEVAYQAENYCPDCGGLPAGLPPQVYDQVVECNCKEVPDGI